MDDWQKDMAGALGLGTMAGMLPSHIELLELQRQRNVYQDAMYGRMQGLPPRVQTPAERTRAEKPKRKLSVDSIRTIGIEDIRSNE